jgi:hypothetical protein
MAEWTVGCCDEGLSDGCVVGWKRVGTSVERMEGCVVGCVVGYPILIYILIYQSNKNNKKQ